MGARPRLLLIDDDPDAVRLLEHVLGEDHDLATAADGVDAWRQLTEADDDLPDLVICDLAMPRLSGDELVRRLRAHDRLAALPVILLTGNTSSNARLEMLEAGVSDYVLKPFPPSELRLRVRNILRDSVLLREVKEARGKMEEANRELREVNAELDRFAAAAAHDLQAPLANIAAYAQVLSEGLVKDEDKQVQLLGSIADNAQRAVGLVNELLNHARTVATSEEVDVIDLTRVISQVAHHLESVIEESGAQLISHEPLSLVSGRQVAIEVMLLNLVSNAIKYRHPDRAPVIEISTSPAAMPSHVEVTVSDNGRGIPAEDREKVFGLGIRGVRDQDGTGIGLATVRAVIARMGGSIELRDSPAPGGLTVAFTLPAG